MAAKRTFVFLLTLLTENMLYLERWIQEAVSVSQGRERKQTDDKK